MDKVTPSINVGNVAYRHSGQVNTRVRSLNTLIESVEHPNHREENLTDMRALFQNDPSYRNKPERLGRLAQDIQI